MGTTAGRRTFDAMIHCAARNGRRERDVGHKCDWNKTSDDMGSDGWSKTNSADVDGRGDVRNQRCVHTLKGHARDRGNISVHGKWNGHVDHKALLPVRTKNEPTQIGDERNTQSMNPIPEEFEVKSDKT